MRVIEFVLPADPVPQPRLGAWIEEHQSVVDLQAAHYAMTGAPNPGLRGCSALRARSDAPDLVRKVAFWAVSQDVPGTRVRQGAVRVLESFEL